MLNVSFADWGRVDYKTAWDRQEALLRKNVEIKGLLRAQPAGELPEPEAGALHTSNHLIFVEHPHVYTLGKSGKEEHVLIGEQERAEKGIGFYPTNRGGDITYHGPEQLVAYPVLDLELFYTDLGRYLRNLEEVIIRTMAEYGLEGDRSPGETGVWMDPHTPGRERKICAMGIRCSRWITMHGLAFNINNDLRYFDYIIPCGIRNKQVTSLQKELGRSVDMNEVKEKVKRNFEEVFGVNLEHETAY
ncbi:MAG: lipoyl(octanoyl) transferase LipB [Bacteroidetes bacterium]|nr:lipoyl(octanoyl) transferase LipB [Bacteroidota bacterium]